jgi:hypothetical protein
MKSKIPSRARGLITALVIAVIGFAVAWVCVRSAMVRLLPPANSALATLAPHDPDLVLTRAAAALVRQRGILAPQTLAAVRRAAQDAPLAANAFVILGHQQLLDGQPARAVNTLEAGQRLDPRNSLVHLLLLDRYLRTGRYADAAAQFSVASRLVGPAQGAIASALAKMSLDPETSGAVRRTLQTDPGLEQAVLITLARSETAPATIFALASPDARRNAGSDGNWGPVLINRLIEGQLFAAARSVWQTIYRVPPTQARALIFDAGFKELPASAPFNWTLTAGSLGAADIRDGTLSINYYGRENGDLARQLLVLAPGSYRLAFTVEGSKTGTGPSVAWTLKCVPGGKAELLNVVATATGTPNRVAAAFTVPSGCPAQQLTLVGNGGEFPAPITLTLRDLDMRAAGATR